MVYGRGGGHSLVLGGCKVGGGSWRVVRMFVKGQDYRDHRNETKVSGVHLRRNR